MLKIIKVKRSEYKPKKKCISYKKLKKNLSIKMKKFFFENLTICFAFSMLFYFVSNTKYYDID